VQLGSRFNLTDQPYWLRPSRPRPTQTRTIPKARQQRRLPARPREFKPVRTLAQATQPTDFRAELLGQVPDRRCSRSKAADSESYEQQRSHALGLGSFWRKPTLSSVNLRLVEMPLNCHITVFAKLAGAWSESNVRSGPTLPCGVTLARCFGRIRASPPRRFA
jgi:hypothetical protein